jgi:hypothetical protein
MNAIRRWFEDNILSLAREMRLSYLPPLMVYVAAGVSGLTAIVGTFFVKDHLGLSAEFLAALGFWLGIPYTIKMPIGHVVDLIWRWKSLMVWLGAALIAASLAIMVGLINHRAAMEAMMSIERWYIVSALLSPIGYVIQDVVADAMTVEAVPRFTEAGAPIPEAEQKIMHTTMQTLGRVAVIGGGIAVAAINIIVFTDTESLSKAAKSVLYARVYEWALVIPLVSVLGVMLASWLRWRARARLMAGGISKAAAEQQLDGRMERTIPNYWVLGGSLVFVLFSVGMGLSGLKWKEEVVFAGSMAIILVMLAKLTRELTPEARATLVGTATVIFLFRAAPGAGDGVTWWMIDNLRFDEHFLSVLELAGSAFALAGLFIFRRFMAHYSIAWITGFLALTAALLTLPTIGMAYGLHEWTMRLTDGAFGPRSLMLVNTTIAAPLSQVAMIPMLAWIARSAPPNLKATYFAVMASFTNLALAAAQLGTKYLNQAYTVSREVRTPVGDVKVAADYSQLGELMIVVMVLGLVLPFAAILFARWSRFKSA